MSYALPSDMQARYPNRDLVQLTNEDPTQITVNTAYLQTFLDDASDEIDSYLEARFSLPLANAPSILTRLCCEIAMFHLQGLRPIHDLEYAKVIYDKACAFLNEVSEGQLTLGLNSATGTEPADPSSPAVVMDENVGGAFGVPQRVFSRATLRGF